MDGERRKRKSEGEEEDREEQKMEQFFALIRSTRGVRDHLSKERENNKRVEDDKLKNVWNPTFQPEDFIHDYQDLAIRSTQLSTHPGPSNEKELEEQDKEPEPEPIAEAPPPPPANHEEKANEEDKLDLTLSL